jgi:cobalt-precorrin 5A hydrolase
VKLRLLAFSDQGEALARRLAQALEGEAARCGQPLSLAQWTADGFAQADGLIFVGAAGIAVRAIAPWVKSKTTDPAVVVVDECAHFAVPILSGHLGGANDLARRIARLCGAVPVLTTATDAHGVFAVDEWAKRQACAVVEPERIKLVSGAVLAGRRIRVYSPWTIQGEPPDGLEQVDSQDCHVRLDVRHGSPGALHLAPKLLTLGMGCRRGTDQETLEAAFQNLLAQSGVWEQSIRAAASIDLKREEPGLLAFCQAHGWSCTFYSARELERAQGDFTPSAFVREITGVDNVCERAAALESGGALIWNKTAGSGVTLALAQAPYKPTWRWQDDGE